MAEPFPSYSEPDTYTFTIPCYRTGCNYLAPSEPDLITHLKIWHTAWPPGSFEEHQAQIERSKSHFGPGPTDIIADRGEDAGGGRSGGWSGRGRARPRGYPPPYRPFTFAAHAGWGPGGVTRGAGGTGRSGDPFAGQLAGFEPHTRGGYGYGYASGYMPSRAPDTSGPRPLPPPSHTPGSFAYQPSAVPGIPGMGGPRAWPRPTPPPTYTPDSWPLLHPFPNNWGDTPPPRTPDQSIQYTTPSEGVMSPDPFASPNAAFLDDSDKENEEERRQLEENIAKISAQFQQNALTDQQLPPPTNPHPPLALGDWSTPEAVAQRQEELCRLRGNRYAASYPRNRLYNNVGMRESRNTEPKDVPRSHHMSSLDPIHYPEAATYDPVTAAAAKELSGTLTPAHPNRAQGDDAIAAGVPHVSTGMIPPSVLAKHYLQPSLRETWQHPTPCHVRPTGMKGPYSK